MVFADVLGIYLAETIAFVQEGTLITPMLLLAAAVLIELTIGMVFLAFVLPRRLNRIANLLAAPIIALFVVGGGSLLPHYILLASFEIAALTGIAWLAWTWPTET